MRSLPDAEHELARGPRAGLYLASARRLANALGRRHIADLRTMDAPDELGDRVLCAICARSGLREGAVVNTRPIAGELGVELQRLFAAVVWLVDGECLEYVGAGPLVKVTALGVRRCENLRQTGRVMPRAIGG